jgi:hypothetical protein
MSQSNAQFSPCKILQEGGGGGVGDCQMMSNDSLLLRTFFKLSLAFLLGGDLYIQYIKQCYA